MVIGSFNIPGIVIEQQNHVFQAEIYCNSCFSCANCSVLSTNVFASMRKTLFGFFISFDISAVFCQ